jgi:hypothetical protein
MQDNLDRRVQTKGDVKPVPEVGKRRDGPFLTATAQRSCLQGAGGWIKGRGGDVPARVRSVPGCSSGRAYRGTGEGAAGDTTGGEGCATGLAHTQGGGRLGQVYRGKAEGCG